LSRQSSNASAKDEPCGWMMKSTWQVVPPKAAAVCPDSTSSIVVVPSERHVEMGVRVDAAREDVLAGRVDDLVGFDVERLADQRDLSPST
jgi:hypothetical protein